MIGVQIKWLVIILFNSYVERRLCLLVGFLYIYIYIYNNEHFVCVIQNIFKLQLINLLIRHKSDMRLECSSTVYES